MSQIFDTIANSRFGYAAGASGTYTVPSGNVVTGVAVHASAAGGSFTIAPGGPNNPSPPVAGPSIPVPAGTWFSLALLGELGVGTVFTFTGTDSYFVKLATSRTG